MRTYTQEEKQAVIDRVIMYRKVKGDTQVASATATQATTAGATQAATTAATTATTAASSAVPVAGAVVVTTKVISDTAKKISDAIIRR